jgi:hypothetical protein
MPSKSENAITHGKWARVYRSLWNAVESGKPFAVSED